MRSLRFDHLLVVVRRLVVDVVFSLLAFCIVILLPLVPAIGVEQLVHVDSFWPQIGIYVLAATIAQLLSKTYRMIWRFVSFQDVIVLAKAATLTVLIFVLLEAVFVPAIFTSPPILLICAALLIWVADIGALTFPRFVARAVLGGSQFRERRRIARTTVLVTGDVQRIENFLRETRHTDTRYQVTGVLVDDSKMHGSYIDGVKVLGTVQEIGAVMAMLRQRTRQEDMPTTLVFAKDNATSADFEKLLQLTASTGLKVGRLPRSGALQGRAQASVEPIELSDLLGRPEVTNNDFLAAEMVEGKCVLITGAGGSIGSELTRQIARLKPARLIVLDFSEFNLYAIDRELDESHPTLYRKALLVDVRDAALVKHWIKEFHPDIVFHAAALKHVPLVEEHPLEGMKTNVVGTVNIAEACCANGVRAMVTISTDKAVNPCNIMGATKRLAEAYCQGLDQSDDHGTVTRFITVRFGNVLGSAGSVVPLFQRQIEAGGPITVTHSDIKRYFMTIPEAVTLVLQAGAQGIHMDEERGSIYVLDMGEPVKIVDLARQMIRLSGQLPDVDIKIEIVGLRPGEKLYEETSYIDELPLPTRNSSIMRLKPRATNLRILQQQVQEMWQSCAAGDQERALRVLRLSVPEYQSESVRSRARVSSALDY